MTRNGKIARLPRDIRNQLNRRLDDGETGAKLVDWLNALPEVQAVLATEFESRPISEQNLSEWKTGGYRDWLIQQETIELVQHMDADSNELAQASKMRLTDLLAQRVAARYVVVARKLNQPNGDGEPDPKLLREFCGDIVALRKGDHSAERLKLERERLDFERDQLSKLREEEFWEWARRPENRDKICTGWLTPEQRYQRINRVRKRLFGCVPEENEQDRPPMPAADPAATERANPAPTGSNQIKPDQTT